MTTDLSNKSVEELRRLPLHTEQISDCGYVAVAVSEEAFDELARRLEEAQESLQDKRRLTRELDVAMHGEEGSAKQASLCDLIEPAKRMRAALIEAQQRNAAHDAKVAAEAKAEALEESADRLVPDQQVHTMFLKDCLRGWAAEYRAKATEAGRKE